MKKIRNRDIIGVILFLIVLIPSIIKKIYLKIIKKELWLISETENMARDNGYIFYKYIRERHPNIECYYVIGKKSPDFNKVSKLGNVIFWASIKHYYYYMSSTWNISSHKEGNPNHPLFSLLHLKLNLYNNRVFLQHGITKDNIQMFYYKNTRFKYFICGAEDEANFIKEKFGYPEKNVVYTGFARFDNLYNNKIDNSIILFVPTWRRWLNTEEDFENSKYLKSINEFLNSEKLDKILREYDKKILFYPHVNMQKYKNKFICKSKNIIFSDLKNQDIQELLKQSCMLITDYSSISFDFAYMKKCLLYYQFDKIEYREKHMPEGYFDYEINGFGDVEYELDNLINKIEENIKNNFSISNVYEQRINDFFTIMDENNCDRIYNLLMGEK